MFDRFNRNINYLRVSVTDRCNLRCRYCMPEDGIQLLRHSEILSYEEITEIVKVAVGLGIEKVRLTGGEPLVRKGITSLISMLARVEGIKDFGLTTNGLLLEEMAESLAKSGLHRINVSLDTIDPDRYCAITRGGNLEKVLRGIDAARKAGLEPVKINCVVKNSSLEEDALGVKNYCEEHGLEVRFIHEMDLESGCFTVVEGGSGGNCGSCNRLRLTANGMIRPCLFNDLEFSVRELGIREALTRAIEFKPEKGTTSRNSKFHNIGG